MQCRTVIQMIVFIIINLHNLTEVFGCNKNAPITVHVTEEVKSKHFSESSEAVHLRDCVYKCFRSTSTVPHHYALYYADDNECACCGILEITDLFVEQGQHTIVMVKIAGIVSLLYCWFVKSNL